MGGGGGGLDLLALSAIFPSFISSFFTQNKGVGAGPSPRSATGVCLRVWKVNVNDVFPFQYHILIL